MGRISVYEDNYPVTGAKRYFSGGSGLSSTLHDYFIFCQALLNKGEYNGVRILQDSTVSLMCTDHLGALRWSDFSSFGYGLRIGREKNPDGKPGRVIDLGWGGAFTTWFSINPSDRVIEIFMTQVIFNPFADNLNNSFDRAVRSSYRK
jgi:CubicO group peptidase (beta-lactamase class C family)